VAAVHEVLGSLALETPVNCGLGCPSSLKIKSIAIQSEDGKAIPDQKRDSLRGGQVHYSDTATAALNDCGRS